MQLLAPLLLKQVLGGPAATGKRGAAALSAAAAAAAKWLLGHPDSFWAARGAGTMLTAARQALASSDTLASTSPAAASSLKELLSVSALQAMLPALLPQLSSRSTAVREAALAVLAAYDTPFLLPVASEAAAGKSASSSK
jgi:hypothetical protein